MIAFHFIKSSLIKACRNPKARVYFYVIFPPDSKNGRAFNLSYHFHRKKALKPTIKIFQLSWRIADSIQSSRKHEAVEILSGAESALAEEQGLILSLDVEACMRRQLATAGYSTGTRQVASRVMDQLRTTLYDYPCIENCKELKNYALESAHLAWSCLAHDTPLIIDTVESSRVRLSLDVEFRRELHSRHHTSPNPMGKKIVGVIWPGLRQTNLQGPCLYRAVVLTT